MRLILSCILIAFFSSATLSQAVIVGRSTISVPAGGCGSIGIIDENFDGTGFCVFTPVVAGTNVLNPDDTTDPQSSPYALKMTYAENANVYAYKQITPVTGILYYKIKVKVLGTFASNFNDNYLFSANTGSSLSGPSNVFNLRLGQTSSTTPRFTLMSSSSVEAYFVGALNTWYTILIKYYSDGSTPTEWKVDGVAKTSVAEPNNRDAAYVYIGTNTTFLYSLNSSGFLIDDVVVSTSASDVGW